MQPVEALVDLFRQNGLKITPQRRTILDLLSRENSHPTADGIYQRVLSVMPDISRTTVYNTLRELVTLGELAEVHAPNEVGIRYDTNSDVHHHLFCTRCSALADIQVDFTGLTPSLQEASGYQITRMQVTFYGICPNCQSQTGPQTEYESQRG